ncbi:MAG: YkgJ family cysteine cluster protein [Candidatus Sifarchaeia archaeon]
MVILMNLSCEQCGNCCLEWGGYLVLISEQDIDRWRNENRHDILRYIEFLEKDAAFGWVKPQNKTRLSRCPFLYKKEKSNYFCLIHNTKPKRCKDYSCTFSD